MMPIVDRRTSRRRFIQFLAASRCCGASLSALAADPFPERPADPFGLGAARLRPS